MELRERTISLTDRYAEQMPWSAFLLVVILILNIFFQIEPWGFVAGVVIGTIGWPLVWHKIGLGEPR